MLMATLATNKGDTTRTPHLTSMRSLQQGCHKGMETRTPHLILATKLRTFNLDYHKLTQIRTHHQQLGLRVPTIRTLHSSTALCPPVRVPETLQHCKRWLPR